MTAPDERDATLLLVAALRRLAALRPLMEQAGIYTFTVATHRISMQGNGGLAGVAPEISGGLLVAEKLHVAPDGDVYEIRVSYQPDPDPAPPLNDVALAADAAVTEALAEAERCLDPVVEHERAEALRAVRYGRWPDEGAP